MAGSQYSSSVRQASLALPAVRRNEPRAPMEGEASPRFAPAPQRCLECCGLPQTQVWREKTSMEGKARATLGNFAPSRAKPGQHRASQSQPGQVAEILYHRGLNADPLFFHAYVTGAQTVLR